MTQNNEDLRSDCNCMGEDVLLCGCEIIVDPDKVISKMRVLEAIINCDGNMYDLKKELGL